MAASSNADQNLRRWPCLYCTRSHEKAYHPSLGTRPIQKGELCGLTLTEGQAESPAGRQDYKPAQSHFVSIFSTHPWARFNSHWAVVRQIVVHHIKRISFSFA